MRKITILFIFILFIVSKDNVTLSAVEALNVWSKNIFPVLFPTFIISDLLLSTGVINYLTKFGGNIFSKIFNTSKYGIYIFFISLISGTPTNAKNLKMLYDDGYVNEIDIVKILSFSYFFNPFFIISFTNLKVLIILWISNIITGIILRKVLPNTNKTIFKPVNFKFNLNISIQNNINILLSILGTMTVFFVLSSIIPLRNLLIKTLFSGLLEVTSGLHRVNTYFFGNEYLFIIIISLGGLSILSQIKSILKDTHINYNYLLFSRIISMIIGLIICFLT